MKRSGNCSNCARGTSIKVNPDILCSIHGVVSRNYRCSRYVRKVAQWSTEAPRTSYDAQWSNKCIDCEFFTLTYPGSEHDPSTGYCKLFTVRQYDGTAKTPAQNSAESLKEIYHRATKYISPYPDPLRCADRSAIQLYEEASSF